MLGHLAVAFRAGHEPFRFSGAVYPFQPARSKPIFSLPMPVRQLALKINKATAKHNSCGARIAEPERETYPGGTKVPRQRQRQFLDRDGIG